MKCSPCEVFQVTLEPEKPYFWCVCGHSKKQPFCDGSHKGSSLKSLPFQVEKKQTIVLCGCKKTNTPPYCDGTHSS